MKSKRSPLGLLHQASVASEGASTTGQKRQAKIAVLELSLGRELKRWIFSMIKSIKNDQNNSSKDQNQKKLRNQRNLDRRDRKAPKD